MMIGFLPMDVGSLWLPEVLIWMAVPLLPRTWFILTSGSKHKEDLFYILTTRRLLRSLSLMKFRGLKRTLRPPFRWRHYRYHARGYVSTVIPTAPLIRPIRSVRPTFLRPIWHRLNWDRLERFGYGVVKKLRPSDWRKKTEQRIYNPLETRSTLD